MFGLSEMTRSKEMELKKNIIGERASLLIWRPSAPDIFCQEAKNISDTAAKKEENLGLKIHLYQPLVLSDP